MAVIIKAAKTDAIMEKGFSINLRSGREDYLYVLFKTKTMLYANGEYCPVEPGTGIFYEKNVRQSYFGCDNVNFNHDFLLFDLENDREQDLFCSIGKNVPLYHADPERMSDAIRAIEKEYLISSSFGRDITSFLGRVFLYKELEDLEYSDTAGDFRLHYKKLHELRRAIYNKPFEDWCVEKMAQHLCLSRYYFQRLYKQFFRVSCISDVINARLDMAKMLLLSTDISIAAVAEKCGYENVEHFNRQFKNRVGTTPKKFRK
ncbi:MAG: helix-turn-helix transcriptional regulator [Clostridia bacterium]|nr:helix-turn-helix transcriptional regulator [Clostridia bacterium]